MIFSKQELRDLNRPCVYVFLDHEIPLYVGYSAHGLERVFQHRSHSRWWKEFTKVTVTFYDTPWEAKLAEVEIIKVLSPKYNTHGNATAPGKAAFHRNFIRKTSW